VGPAATNADIDDENRPHDLAGMVIATTPTAAGGVLASAELCSPQYGSRAGRVENRPFSARRPPGIVVTEPRLRLAAFLAVDAAGVR
jgi:hypothetical protein